MSPAADEILEMLCDIMVDNGFFTQCLADRGGNDSLHVLSESVLGELLSSGQVEIGEVKERSPGDTEFVAWTGPIEDRIRRAENAVRNAVSVGDDQEFAYWLCLRGESGSV